MKKLLKKSLASLVLLSSLLPVVASAQSLSLVKPPADLVKILLTWQADSFAPLWYQGRILPARGGVIKVAAQVVQDSLTINLAEDMNFAWRINGTLVQEGKNNEAVLRVGEFSASEYEVLVQVESQGQVIGQSAMLIPVKDPIISLSIPYPKKLVPQENAVFEAIPFFFAIKNSSDLNFSWNINYVNIPREETLGSLIAVSFSKQNVSAPVTASADRPGSSLSKIYSRTNVFVK